MERKNLLALMAFCLLSLSACGNQLTFSQQSELRILFPNGSGNSSNEVKEISLTEQTSFNGLPDFSITPGAVDGNITQDNINDTICVSGYTATIRPSTTYTNNIKRQLIVRYGYNDTNMSSYELDHMIPLSIGGCPDCVENLWPEPWEGEFGAHAKDVLENRLHRAVCNGSITLAEAQRQIMNWTAYVN
jgi:hypothetical protein